MKARNLALLVLLAAPGCAQTQASWSKPGSTAKDFHMDTGQCRVQAFSVGLGTLQSALIFNSCMQGKGWYQEQRPM